LVEICLDEETERHFKMFAKELKKSWKRISPLERVTVEWDPVLGGTISTNKVGVTTGKYLSYDQIHNLYATNDPQSDVEEGPGVMMGLFIEDPHIKKDVNLVEEAQKLGKKFCYKVGPVGTP